MTDPRLYDARTPTDNSVDNNKLQDGAVTTPKLADLAVTSAKLGALAVVAGKIATGAINNVNLFATGVVDSAAILDGTILNIDVNAAAAIAGSKLGSGTVTDTQIAAANKDGAAGTPSMRTLSTTATTAAAGNDSRLSDTRTPTAASITQAMFSSTYRATFTGTSAPASPATGDIWVDTTGGRISEKVYNGTTWIYSSVSSQPLYAARMYRSAAFTNLAAAVTILQIPYDTVDYDYSSAITTGAGAKYTCPVAGLYMVNSSHELLMESNPDEFRLSIYLNGVEARRGTRATVRGASAGDVWAFVVSAQIICAASDTLDIRVSHQTGGNPAPQTAGSSTAYAEFTRI